jgi:hypothetical protein
MWAGYGKGRPCDGCDTPVEPMTMEHESDCGDGHILRFHPLCASVWTTMLNGDTGPM